MFDKLKKFIKGEGVELTSYVLFGVLTTAVNFVLYFGLTKIFGVDHIISNIVAWFFSVAVSFVSSKYVVFKDKGKENKKLISEIFEYYSFRVASGALETGALYLFVNVLGFDETVPKFIAAVFVVVVNYLFSKLYIFKGERK